MKKHLCIDWGNSRVKIGYFEDNYLEKEYNYAHEEGEIKIMSLIGQLKPNAVIFCSVADHPAELINNINEQTKLVVLNNQTDLPFMNAYQSPKTLGADRLALVAGAQKHFPNETCLVICIGTAITYNFLQRGQLFRGGNITPGINMRLRSLNDYAKNLPLVSESGSSHLLGYDTEAGIRSGVLWGIAAEIEGIIGYYEEQYSCKNTVLTGGHLATFENKFKSKIFADAQILLKGLNEILKHNVYTPFNS